MLLAEGTYDPAVSVSKSTAAQLAQTAIDTVNVRAVFNGPANGAVQVRLKGLTHGSNLYPQIMLGCLEGATVRGRMVGMGGQWTNLNTTMIAQDAAYVITGLTPAQQYTWDAAYGVDFAVSTTGLKYGGPNDATANNAFGAFHFEIWDAPNLLAGTLYDPGTAVTAGTTALAAMAAFDTTNLRHTFTAPDSGKIMWRMAVPFHGNTGIPEVLFGLMNGATVMARSKPVVGRTGTNLATTYHPHDATGILGGLTPGASYTLDAGFSVETGSAAGGLKYGGPNTATTASDAFGGFAYEIWAA